MKAIILVAGYASRLYPLTLNKPKALLTLNATTLLDFLMKKLSYIDAIDEVVLVSNDKFYNQFENWKQGYKGKFTITVLNDGTSTNETRLGAIGDLQFAIDSLKIDDDIMVLVSDNYFTFSLKDFYNYYKEKNTDCILVTEFTDLEYLGKHFGVVYVDNNERVLNMVEKPGGIPASNIGAYATYIYKKETVKLIKQYLNEGNNKDAPGNFPSWLCSRKPIHAYSFKGKCYDIGTIDVYNSLNAEITLKENKNRRLKISKKQIKRK